MWSSVKAGSLRKWKFYFWVTVVCKSALHWDILAVSIERWISHPCSWETFPIPHFQLYVISSKHLPSKHVTAWPARESEASVILAAIIRGLRRRCLFRGSHAHPVAHSRATIQMFFLAFCGASATVRNQRVFLLHLLQYLQHLWVGW